jgi:hypothetical protein
MSRVDTAARAKPARPLDRRRKRRLGGRFINPETIVSVDLLPEDSES